MEETTVLIIGAGPSGLSLGTLLSRMGVKVVILEKELEVSEDPRGITIRGEAVRISYQIGIGDALTKKIGKDIGVLHFHGGSFRNPAFMNFDLTWDWASQGVSNCIAQFQPNFERELRSVLQNSPTCELRSGCEVLGRIEEEDVNIIEYRTVDGTKKFIRTAWLIGADGKRGITRKKFLEPFGIKQEVGGYEYVGTWVAANLKVTLPTPETHPEFPLWKLGHTPSQVHEVFWPSGFHFCNNTKRPAVSGRFGPEGARYWRHEFSVEPEDSLKDVQADFWKQFGPWMIIPGSKFSRTLRGTVVEFPRDCIEVLRCRPFQFACKIVNRWFHRKIILIGDAAGIFPPFGGQGIASGMRAAQSLSWRLAMMSHLQVNQVIRERVLEGWSEERKQDHDKAMESTRVNGNITNQRSVILAFLHRCLMRFLWSIPGLGFLLTRTVFRDDFGFRYAKNGFFLERARGGIKLPQIYLKGVTPGEAPRLSDGLIFRNIAHLALLVLVQRPEDLDPTEIKTILEEVSMPNQILTMQDLTYVSLSGKQHSLDKGGSQYYYPCKEEELLEEGISPMKGYDPAALQSRLGKSAKYVVLRPDFFVHSVAADLSGLSLHLEEVKSYFCNIT